MKRNPSPAPSLSPEELKQLEDHLAAIGATVSRVRVTARSLQHEEAKDIKPPAAVYEDPVFLDSCSQVLSDVADEVWELYGKCLALLPEYKDPAQAKP